jgi:hypothetical protein
MNTLLREKIMRFFNRRDQKMDSFNGEVKREEDSRSSLYYVRSHVY